MGLNEAYSLEAALTDYGVDVQAAAQNGQGVSPYDVVQARRHALLGGGLSMQARPPRRVPAACRALTRCLAGPRCLPAVCRRCRPPGAQPRKLRAGASERSSLPCMALGPAAMPAALPCPGRPLQLLMRTQAAKPWLNSCYRRFSPASSPCSPSGFSLIQEVRSCFDLSLQPIDCPVGSGCPNSLQSLPDGSDVPPQCSFAAKRR